MVVVIVSSRFFRPIVIPIEHRQKRPDDADRDGNVNQMQNEQADTTLDLNRVFLNFCVWHQSITWGTSSGQMLLDFGTRNNDVQRSGCWQG